MGLMFRRRRPVARLAAGAATAGIAYHAGKRRSQQDTYNAEADEAYQNTQYAPPPPAQQDSGGGGGGSVDELNRLVELHNSGALTDAEFAAAKAKALGMQPDAGS